jgi:hypothetical protein
MSSEPCDDDRPHGDPGTTNPVYAAVARSLTRGAALYFSRPVRLFRPSKSKHPHVQQAILLFSFLLSGPICKQSQRLSISQESRCQRWGVLESRFCIAACENAGSASGECPVKPVLLIAFFSDTSHWKALSSTTHCERVVGHCPMGDLCGELLGLGQL